MNRELSGDPNKPTTHHSILHTTFAHTPPSHHQGWRQSTTVASLGHVSWSCYSSKSWPMSKLSASSAAYLSWIVQHPLVSGRPPFMLPTSTTITCWFGLDRSHQIGDLLLLCCGEGRTVHTARLCRLLRAHILKNPAKPVPQCQDHGNRWHWSHDA